MNLQDIKADPSSFRDPAGKVFCDGERIIRVVSSQAAAAFENVWSSGILPEMAASGRMIATTLLPKTDILYQHFPDASYILVHPLITMITYPYEWPFRVLKTAALAHLELQIELLDKNFILTDASAFNMQLRGNVPVHIDILSVAPYKEGIHWEGYRQFLQQFLNPLLLEALTGVSFAGLFRSTLNGLSSRELRALLPLSVLIRPGTLLHVVLPAWGEGQDFLQREIKPLSKKRYASLLIHLHQIIKRLRPPCGKSAWSDYRSTTSYSDSDAAIKKEIVGDFIHRNSPAVLLDIGCNQGEYSALALQAGAKLVIGVDADRHALDSAYEMSVSDAWAFTPLYMDVTNPSPAQGWRGVERRSFNERVKADALIALALTHHLCIGNNIPVKDVIEYLVQFAPRGIIEFIPKTDKQVKELLRYRHDHFDEYVYDSFKKYLSQCARIVDEHAIGDSGRILFVFDRT